MSSRGVRDRLQALDGKGYKAYQSLLGRHDFSRFILCIDYVQGDPFAAPSRFRMLISQSIARFPPDLFQRRSRKIALEDYIARQVFQQTRILSTNRGSGKSGLMSINPPSQAVLPRTVVSVSEREIELRIMVGLPAFGRRIAGSQAAMLICDDLPKLVERTLVYDALNPVAIAAHCDCAENADWMRSRLKERNLVSFIADGAILPRRSGVDERPLQDGAIPFQSPESLRVEFTLPTGRIISGMGVSQGITLIVGGGYHGKSTVLKAIAAGVYNHIPGDGRECVVTDANAVKIRAEDGRSITGVNISPFINHLPQGKSTRMFSTENASGSTSQAASIIEAIEAGATTVLIDEDTSATNFMIRDRRMQALITKDQEPITPFVDKVRQLYDDYGISTILVMGGSGDYFDVADTIIALDNYQSVDVTTQAKAIAKMHLTERQAEGGTEFGQLINRIARQAESSFSRGRQNVKLKVRSTDEIRIASEAIDLSAIEQLVEPGQAKSIAAAILYAQQTYIDGQRPLTEIFQCIMSDIEENGLDCLSDRLSGDLVAFRHLELAAAINRIRSLQISVEA